MEINIKEARQRFSELVNRVAHKKEKIVITSRNKPKAVLVSVEDAETMHEDEAVKYGRIMQLESIRKLREGLARRGIKSDSLTALEKQREDRVGHLSRNH